MFSEITSVVVLAFAALAVAAPGGHGDHYSSSYDCNTGSVQCCEQVQAPGTYDIQKVHGLIGGAIGAITGQVGFQCNPVSVIGGGTAGNCANKAVCCKDYHSASLIGVDCTSATAQA